MAFKTGDTVAVLDEDLKGIITKIHGEDVVVETVDGFEMTFLVSELVKVDNDSTLTTHTFGNTSAADIVKEKEQNTTKKKPYNRPKNRQQPPLEVDLHIHKLTDSTKGMTNHDMLTLQLETARRQLEFAIRKRIQRVVFIHGVGEGVLKMELETLLRRYNNVKFYDANLQQYGFGATEVYIYQNLEP